MALEIQPLMGAVILFRLKDPQFETVHYRWVHYLPQIRFILIYNQPQPHNYHLANIAQLLIDVATKTDRCWWKWDSRDTDFTRDSPANPVTWQGLDKSDLPDLPIIYTASWITYNVET